MDCQTCNGKIEYRFLTNCEHCGNAVEPASLSQPDPIPVAPPVEKRLTWKRDLANIVYMFVSSIVSMISGAVITYVAGAMVYISVFRDVNENPSVACARGTAFAMLSIMLGAFLGTMAGTAFAIKRPLFKTPH